MLQVQTYLKPKEAGSGKWTETISFGHPVEPEEYDVEISTKGRHVIIESKLKKDHTDGEGWSGFSQVYTKRAVPVPANVDMDAVVAAIHPDGHIKITASEKPKALNKAGKSNDETSDDVVMITEENDSKAIENNREDSEPHMTDSELEAEDHDEIVELKEVNEEKPARAEEGQIEAPTKHKAVNREAQTIAKKLWEMSLDVAGFEPSDLQVKVEGDRLIVSAEQEKNHEDGHFLKKMERIVTLPDDVDIDKVESCLGKDSKLRLTAPLKDSGIKKIKVLKQN